MQPYGLFMTLCLLAGWAEATPVEPRNLDIGYKVVKVLVTKLKQQEPATNYCESVLSHTSKVTKYETKYVTKYETKYETKHETKYTTKYETKTETKTR